MLPIAIALIRAVHEHECRQTRRDVSARGDSDMEGDLRIRDGHEGFDAAVSVAVAVLFQSCVAAELQ